MQINKKERKKIIGFTLIESMVVMAIISVIIVGGLLKRKENLERKQVEVEALKVKQMLELARDYALTGETVPAGTENKVPEYFCFSFEGGSKEYKISSLNPNQDPVNNKKGKISNPEVSFTTDSATICYTPPNAEFSCSLSPCEIKLCTSSGCDDSFEYKITASKDSINFQ